MTWGPLHSPDPEVVKLKKLLTANEDFKDNIPQEPLTWLRWSPGAPGNPNCLFKKRRAVAKIIVGIHSLATRPNRKALKIRANARVKKPRTRLGTCPRSSSDPGDHFASGIRPGAISRVTQILFRPPSKFPGGQLQLLQGEHRAVLADQFLADIAPAAHADAAFHPVFQGHDDLIVLVSQFF